MYSGVTLNFLMMALYATLLAQAWNLLGGFGGQFSFGHALFFGSGAYVQAIAQLGGGINPWLALPLAIGMAALVALFIGALAFTSPDNVAAAKLGVLAGSLIAGVGGWLVLHQAGAKGVKT